MEIKDIIQMVLTILGSGAALGFVEFLIKRKEEHQDKRRKGRYYKKVFFFYRQESGSSIVWNVINSPYVVIEDPAG